ncbi:MAG: MltA domain-containing protein, partial [Planctomycetes bacterium]|nr:MltA domain-containing protein [Planctomycetota bacterium]
MRGRAIVCGFTVFLGVLGCVNPGPNVRLDDGKDYYRTLPEGQHALRKITDPRMIPDFSKAFGNVAELRDAVNHSINYMAKPSSKTFFPKSGISHAQVEKSLFAFRDLLDSKKTATQLNEELRKRFDVYTSVGCDDQGTMLFTGYYTPVFDASLTRGGAYQYPIHKLPPNHIKDPITGDTLGRRRADGTIDANYPDRAKLLSSGELKGLELAWLTNPFEAYVAMVQGSAFLRLPDGTQMEVGYAGNNGQDYTSISMELVKSGKMKREQLNLRSMIEYFKKNPQDFEPLAAKNKRYVFFQPSTGGPFG